MGRTARGNGRLVVEDNEIGIALQHQDRLFRVFERLHGREEYSGMGIRLAIVRHAAERMGGGFGVDSEPGRGSRFYIDLRLADPGTSAVVESTSSVTTSRT